MKKSNQLTLAIMLVFIWSCQDFLNQPVREKNNNTDVRQELNTNNPFDSSFTEPRTADFSEKNFLLNIGLNVISTNTDQFLLDYQYFKLKLNQSCQVGKVFKSEQILPEWKKLVYAFHKMDSQSFGPIADKNASTQLAPRTEIYSWPYSNHCLADRQVYYQKFDPQSELKLPYNSKSLDTIEYLLFAPNDQVKCSLKAHAYLNNWLALDTETKNLSRCQLAVQLTQQLENSVKKLSDQWNRNQANFSKTLTDGSRYSDLKSAINDYSDALYSLETIKDIRLGGPLGKNKKNCTETKCPNLVEHIYSDTGLIAIQARLDGFTEGFFGGDLDASKHHGFDDYLNQSGHQAIVLKMKNQIEIAQQRILQLPTNSLNQLVADMNSEQCVAGGNETICQFYEDIRQISSTLKTEVLIALSLKSPPVYQGDND